MTVKNNIFTFLNSEKFLAYIIATILSTLFIGFAPSSIAVGIFVFFSVKYSLTKKNKQQIDWKLLIPIALYILFSLSLFWSVDVEQTRKGIDRTVVLMLIPIAFNIIPKFKRKSFDLIFDIFTTVNSLFGLFFLATAFLRYLQSSSLKEFTYHELVQDLELNAIYVSVSFAISFFYLLSKKSKSILDTTKLIFMGILVVLLSSKILFILLILGFLIFIFSSGLSRTKLTITIFIGIMVIGFAALKSIERFNFETETNISEVWTKQEFGQVYLWTGSSIRLFQLRHLKDQLKEDAIFWKGFGLFASKDNLRKRHLKFNTYPGFHDYNYHNQYAQTLSETGIIGLLLLLTMLGVLIVKAYKTRGFLFLMFSFTIFFVFFTESFLYRQTGLFLFIIFYCLFNRTIFEKDTKKKIATNI